MTPFRYFMCAGVALATIAVLAGAGSARAASSAASSHSPQPLHAESQVQAQAQPQLQVQVQPQAASSPAMRGAAPLALVVDVQRVLRESLAAKDVQKQLDTQRARFQTETEGEENELRRAEQDLVKSREQLDTKTYAAREKLLRQRFLTVERHVEARRKALDAAFTESMNAVRNALVDVVQAVAKARGAPVVIAKQQIIWMEQGLDATDDVLAQLNARLARVPMELEVPAETAPDALPLQNREAAPSVLRRP